MQREFSRTARLFGNEAMERLSNSRVAVFGVGGVGGYVVEALARSGVGELDLVDNDTVSESNINRQIIALHSTIGRYKVEVAAERVHDINPSATVRTYTTFFTEETADEFDFSAYDYVVDAIDTVAGKIALVMRAKRAGTPIICSMGTGNKLDPTAFEVTDIYKTSVCPLAKVMRTELRKRGIRSLKVVYSKEIPIKPFESEEEKPTASRRAIPASVSFVPSAAGLILAGEVIKDLVGFHGNGNGA